MSESSKNPPDEGINRPTQDVEQNFYVLLKHDTTTLLKTGIRLARKIELLFEELEVRGE